MLLWCKLGTTITVTRKGKYHNEIGAIISISALMKTGMVRFDSFQVEKWGVICRRTCAAR